MRSYYYALLMLIASCNVDKGNNELPILGQREIIEKEVDGTTIIDTTYHKIGDFSFLNQDSAWVTNKTFKEKIYVADFFFTTCPTICPIMKTQMLRVYEHYANEPRVGFLSHTIDPEYDTVALLRDYAERLEVTSDRWNFVTGEKQTIYELAQTSYYATAHEDPAEAGGFVHSGAFILVDNNRHIRGMYDGTDEEKVSLLIRDIKKLLTKNE